MAEATIGKRFMGFLGPVRLELIEVTSISSTNTVTTNMPNPLWGAIRLKTTGSESTGDVSISGKVMTLDSDNDGSISAKPGVAFFIGF